MVPQMKMLVAALAAGLVLATSLVVPASANEPTRIKIASASHKEDGCSGLPSAQVRSDGVQLFVDDLCAIHAGNPVAPGARPNELSIVGCRQVGR